MVDSYNGDDFETKISIPAASSSESKWKEKVQELQPKLASMEKNSQLGKARICQEMEAKYQSLCDSYENRMAQITIQIDNSGYDDGIRESEEIIDSIRKSTEKEIEASQQQLVRAHQQPSQQQVEASSSGVHSLDKSLKRWNRPLFDLNLRICSRRKCILKRKSTCKF
jgi:hypothetical protein